MAKRKSKAKGEDKRHSKPRTAGKAFGAYWGTSAATGGLVAGGLTYGLARQGAWNPRAHAGAIKVGRSAGLLAGAAAGTAVAVRGIRKRRQVKAGTLPRRKRRTGRGGRQRRDSKGKFK